MKKEYLIYVLIALILWFARDTIPTQFQFWKNINTTISVQNNSGQDLSDVTVVVWSKPHSLGTIRKGTAKSFNTSRTRDITDVFITFKYGAETVERLVGTLYEDSDYKMTILVNFAGVVTAQTGTALSGDSDDKAK